MDYPTTQSNTNGSGANLLTHQTPIVILKPTLVKTIKP